MPAPKAGWLRDLRLSRNITQVELAEKMGIAQVSISRTELSENITLSTLRRYVEALDGSLEMSVKFKDGESFPLT